MDGKAIGLTGSLDNTARLWDLATGSTQLVLTGHSAPITSVALHHIDGIPVALTTGRDGLALVWDLRTGSVRTTFDRHSNEVVALAIKDIDGRPVALTGSRDGTAMVWDPHTAEVLDLLDNRLDDPGEIWDMRTGRMQTILQASRVWARAVALGRVGRQAGRAHRRSGTGPPPTGPTFQH